MVGDDSGGGWGTIGRVAAIIAAVALIAVGLVTFVSPLPFGIVLVAIGVGILISASPWSRRLIRALRSRFGWLDRGLDEAESKLPGRFSEPLEATDPTPDDGATSSPAS